MGNSDFVIENNILVKYEGPGGDVTLPDGITAIGERAFQGCAALKSIVIPEGVRYIGQSAFAPCAGLVEVTLPESLETLDEFAFSNCRALTHVKLPSNLTSIMRSAFSMCSSLKSITLPDKLERLPRGVFLGCKSLSEIHVPASVTEIDIEAFSGCSSLMYFYVDGENPVYRDIEGVLYSKDGKRLVYFPGGRMELYFPDGTEEIGPGAFFENLNFDRIGLPESLKIMGERAFYRCSELWEIQLPEKLRSVGESCFEGCTGLKSMYFPDSMILIEESAFRKCSALKWIRVPESMRFDLHWFAAPHDPPCFSVDHSAIPFVNTRPVEDIKSEMGLRRAAEGFIMASMAGVEMSPEISGGYLDHIRDNSRDFYEMAMDDADIMGWFAAHDMIQPQDVEKLLEAAANKGNAGVSALLLGYKRKTGEIPQTETESIPEIVDIPQTEKKPVPESIDIPDIEDILKEVEESMPESLHKDNASSREQINKRFSALESALDDF